jgi:hypothetical protein
MSASRESLESNSSTLGVNSILHINTSCDDEGNRAIVFPVDSNPPTPAQGNELTSTYETLQLVVDLLNHRHTISELYMDYPDSGRFTCFYDGVFIFIKDAMTGHKRILSRGEGEISALKLYFLLHGELGPWVALPYRPESPPLDPLIFASPVRTLSDEISVMSE